ncbi:MAG TPA: alpha/beta hydrolase [Verrucomicrobiae bacterium]|nr:alpha/beta hydrolase [Verrucomicrobiae bacterium]
MSQRLSFETSGRGRVPLICVHGWACNGGQFTELRGLLADDFRVFRLDLPGHGKTPLENFKPGFESYARAITEFCIEQKLERPVFLGHSMGGVLCLIAAAAGVIQPRAVINLDGTLPAAARLTGVYPALEALLAAPDFREQFAGVVRKSFFLETERDARCDAIVQTMCSAPEAVLRFLPEQAGDLRPEEILPNVLCPVLYVGAAQPRFDADKAASLIPHFTFEQIPEAGHFLHVYAVDKLAKILLRFLTSISAVQ